MDGDLADEERTVRDPARALIDKVVDVGLPLVRPLVRRVQLSRGEVFEAAVVQTSEGDVDVVQAEHGRDRVGDHRRFGVQLGLPVVEGVVGLWGRRGHKLPFPTSGAAAAGASAGALGLLSGHIKSQDQPG